MDKVCSNCYYCTKKQVRTKDNKVETQYICDDKYYVMPHWVAVTTGCVIWRRKPSK